MIKLKYLKKQVRYVNRSRYTKKSKILNWPLSRRILSYISNSLAKLFLSIPVTDYTNGFRFYSKESAIHIANNCGKIGDGFIVLSEILMELYYNGFKISETSTILKIEKEVRVMLTLNLFSIPSWAYLNYFSLN